MIRLQTRVFNWNKGTSNQSGKRERLVPAIRLIFAAMRYSSGGEYQSKVVQVGE